MKESLPHGVPAPFQALLAEHEFVSLDERSDEESFGNSVLVLVSPDFKIRFVMDRGQSWVDVAPGTAANAWYDLGLLKQLIGAAASSEPPSLEELARFLSGAYETVRELLSEARFSQTARDLETLALQAAKARWPRWYKDR